MCLCEEGWLFIFMCVRFYVCTHKCTSSYCSMSRHTLSTLNVCFGHSQCNFCYCLNSLKILVYYSLIHLKAFFYSVTFINHSVTVITQERYVVMTKLSENFSKCAIVKIKFLNRSLVLFKLQSCKCSMSGSTFPCHDKFSKYMIC